MLSELKGLKGKWNINCKTEPVDHGEYVDLGNYVIDLGVFDQNDHKIGIDMINSRIDTLPKTMCTGIVKRNKKGDVILGRNQDLEVSNYPVYISHLTGGKYNAVSFNYNNVGEITYAEYQKGVKMPDSYRQMYMAAASDSFNEEGLYIQGNMRWGGDHPSTGTNPGGLRCAMGAIASLVTQNCKTVDEALEYIKTLDLYSAGATKDGQARSGWDCGYMIGDATGEYGIIEFANNLMYYTPYANGHCNAFVSPLLQATDRVASGYGRLAMGQQSMIGAQTAKDMMEAIHKADWRREIEDIKYSYKDEYGNPHFVDKDGNPSVDFRCEATLLFPVDEFGKLVRDEATQEDFLKLYNYLEWVGKADTALPLYLEKERKLTPELKEKLEQLKMAVNVQYHQNCDNRWLMDNANFDEVKEAYIKWFEFNNAFELVEQFNAGDEKAIRDKGDIFTTGMNFGVNCAEKYLMVRFMENDDCIYEYQW